MKTVVTEQLKPERFDNYEAGVKWDVRPALSLTVKHPGVASLLRADAAAFVRLARNLRAQGNVEKVFNRTD